MVVSFTFPGASSYSDLQYIVMAVTLCLCLCCWAVLVVVVLLGCVGSGYGNDDGVGGGNYMYARHSRFGTKYLAMSRSGSDDSARVCCVVVLWLL